MSSWKLVACARVADRPAHRRGARLGAQPAKRREDTNPATRPRGPGQLPDLKYIRKTTAGANAPAMYPIHFPE
jgi:hypothetical protein